MDDKRYVILNGKRYGLLEEDENPSPVFDAFMKGYGLGIKHTEQKFGIIRG